MRTVCMVLLLSSFLSLRLQQPVEVCELLRHVESYDGKIITISGFLGGGGRHGPFLTQDPRYTPCPQMPLSKQDWPSAIAVTWPGADTGRRPVPFGTDAKAAELFYTALQRVGPDRLLKVTLEGQVRTRNSIRIFHDK